MHLILGTCAVLRREFCCTCYVFVDIMHSGELRGLVLSLRVLRKNLRNLEKRQRVLLSMISADMVLIRNIEEGLKKEQIRAKAKNR